MKACLGRYVYHIGGKLVPAQVLDILVVCVDYFSELASIHHFLKHPHVDHAVKRGVGGRVGAHDLGYGRAPADTQWWWLFDTNVCILATQVVQSEL